MAKVSEKTKQKEFFSVHTHLKIQYQKDDENNRKEIKNRLFHSIQKGNPLFIEIVFCSMTIASIKEQS